MEIEAKKLILHENYLTINFSEVNEVSSKQSREILKQCFSLWRRKTRAKKEKMQSVKLKLEQREKLDNLIKALKKYRKEKDSVETPKLAKCDDSRPQVILKENYKNRYEAQKSAVEKLTMKLEEKDRLIDELKLGILSKETLKNINDAKSEIRQIFANCSVNVRCKLVPPPDYSRNFMVSTQKAPKIMQQMQERALDRAKKREIIQERKRIIEENRQRIIIEALEKKRVQDEDEKRRNLEVMKERRRKELEMEKIRQANKLIFMEKYNKAVAFHNEKLLQKSLKNLISNVMENRRNRAKSERHYRLKLLTKTFTPWKEIIEQLHKIQNAKADALFSQKLVKRAFHFWWVLRIERIRDGQVAEDFHDFLLVKNTFIHWHRYVCKQFILREKQMKFAQHHHNRKICFHYFYLWRSLPAVVQLEKAKEQKMKKWREKVWEILPDYKPPQDDDY